MDRLRVLLDTNVIIALEDDRKLANEATTFYREASKYALLLFHPKTLEDIQRDKDHRRLEITLSKTSKYESLEDPPAPALQFLKQLGVDDTNPNDVVDANLLYALYRKSVNFLVTEDNGIIKWAKRLEIHEQVLTIVQASEMFSVLSKRKMPHQELVESKPVYNLNLQDHFFDSFRNSYPKFDKWFDKISTQGRKSWVILEKGKIQAICIYNEERDKADSERIPLPTLKLNSFKVSDEYSGKKISELLLKMAFQYATENNLASIYLTTYPDRKALIYVIEDFGFIHVDEKIDELVYLKKMLKPAYIPDKITPVSYAIEFYPHFIDGLEIQKFIVPIKPEFHERLFPDYPGRERNNVSDISQLRPEGNTIKKAYICNSNSNKVNEGDILLFYRSHDLKEIQSIGIVEKTLRSSDFSEIAATVSNRTVYTLNEIKEMAARTALVIIFRHQQYLSKPISMSVLEEQLHIIGPIQSIRKINHQVYHQIVRGNN